MEEFTKVRRKARRKKEEYDESSPLYYAKLLKRFNEVLGQFQDEDQLTTAIKKVNQAILSLGSDSKIHNIVCYGLGSVSNSKTSMYQFALVFKMSQSLGCPLYLYDPVFSEADSKLFESLECSLHLDDRGHYKIDRTTLFFLPHCPRFVYENLLRANWGPDLSKCVIFGDDLLSIADKLPTRTLKDNLPFIHGCQPFVEVFPIENNFKFDDVFNDLAVHIFSPSKLASVDPETWNCEEVNSVCDHDSW
ncbi:SRR1 [Nesidiocoris tenuis]|uniref:SRR1 n=1 Tax=Nesidiocoris tenuis TaxID=355587 RepID=A0ABN7ASF2_9HEMI|nr:SRR1 [Nesidiocoris tenuis]